MSKIFPAMAAILAEFPSVGKDQKNPSQGYSYRGVDDALEAANRGFAKHKVFIQVLAPTVEFSDAGETKAGKSQVRCVYNAAVRFTHEDGSYVESSMVGEGIDTSDKALMKAQANAMKYLIWYTFVVPTREKLDSEAYEDPEGGSKAGGGKKRDSKKSKPDGDDGPPDGESYDFDTSVTFKEACAMLTKAQEAGKLVDTEDDVKAWCLARPKGDKERAALVAAYRRINAGEQPTA